MVLDGTWLHYERFTPAAGHRRSLRLSRPPTSIDDLVGALDTGDHPLLLWITAGGCAWLGLPTDLATLDRAAHPFFAADGWSGGETLSWTVRLRHRGRRVTVIFPAYDPDGRLEPWSDLDVDRLLSGLAAFRWAVGAQAGPTIGQTAEALLLATHPRERGGARLDQRPSLPAELERVAEVGSSWRRPLLPAEAPSTMLPRWVHWYDANANYLGAYQTAELGRGAAGLVAGEDLHRVLTERYLPPGIWHAALPGGEELWPDERQTLPHAWSTSTDWHTTPTIVRARELGVDLAAVVSEAWVWPSRSRFCAPFATVLRDARARLLAIGLDDTPGAREAFRAVSMCYQRLHGRFGAGFRASAGGPLYRPDWMHTIRAQARVNLHRRLAGLGAGPFAVDIDGVYFVTVVDDPHLFAEEINLPVGGREQLGRFRWVGSAPLTAELYAELVEATTAVATRKVLHALGARPAAAPAAEAEELEEVPEAAAEEDGDEGFLRDLEELAASLAELGGDEL